MTREEKMESWWRRHNKLATIDRDRYFDKANDLSYGYWSALHIGTSPLWMHMSMFFTSIDILSSEEQREKWLPRVKALNILGCYA